MKQESRKTQVKDQSHINGFPVIAHHTLPLTSPPHFGEKLAICWVVGDLLKDAGIFDGDEVIFKFTDEARTGDLVIATMPLGTNIKYFRQKIERVILKAANKQYLQEMWDKSARSFEMGRSIARKHSS